MFEFFRNESLNARNFFALDQPGQAEVPAQPVRRRDRRADPARPDVLLRRLSGAAADDRPHGHLDGADGAAAAGRLHRGDRRPRAGHLRSGHDGTATRGTPFPGNTIPAGRMDPVARSLLERYPLPTSAGTANNYRRVGRRDRRSGSVQRAASTIASRRTATRSFGRLTRFGETFIPVTPLPDGSGVTTGTLGPQDTTSWSFASSYQRTFSNNILNELRIGDTRRSVGRDAAELAGSASASLGIPGIPSNARFPNTLPTFLIAGYQQLGSPANTATDFGTSVTQIADSLTWLKGRHTAEDGRGPAVGAPRTSCSRRRRPARSPSAICSRDLPGTANTGTPLASFLLGQVQQFSIDLQQEQIRNRAQLPGVLHPGRLARLGSRDHQRRPALHAQLSLDRRERPGRRLQPRDTAARVPRRRTASRARRGSCTRTTSARASASSAASPTRRSRASATAGLDRNGRHHDAVHDAGVSVPADGVAADARQHRAGVRPGQRSAGRADSADAGRGPRTGRLRRRSRSRLGLRAAVERVGAARAHRRTSRSRSPTSDRRSRTSASPTPT